MRRWGQRIEVSEAELRLAINLVSREVVRQITRKITDPELVGLLEKLTKALARMNQPLTVPPRQNDPLLEDKIP